MANKRFTVLGNISEIETIAVGRRIRSLRRLRKLFGGRKWRKKKGIARICLSNGDIVLAELHWYEAQGIGKKAIKIKKIFD